MKPKMEKLKSLEHRMLTTTDEHTRCQAMELSRFYFLLKWVYQCTAEASDVIRVWNPDDKELNQLPVCLYHKEHWLTHYGGEFGDKGEIQKAGVMEG